MHLITYFESRMTTVEYDGMVLLTCSLKGNELSLNML